MRFILPFLSNKTLTPLSLVIFPSSCFVDPKHLLTFFTELLSRIPTDKAPDAHVLLLATLSRAKLVYGDEDGAKKDMEEAWKVLDDLSDVESRVRAAYYSVAADYYKARSISGFHLTSCARMLIVRPPSLSQSLHHTTATHCYTLLVLSCQIWTQKSN